MKHILFMIMFTLVSCSSSDLPTGNSSLVCVSIEAAALVKWFSTTTLIEGVVGPTDENGAPILTAQELAAAMETCFADPQSQVLLEALRQLNTATEGG